MTDPALVFMDDRYGTQTAGTHVIIIGVGHYSFGKDGASGRHDSIVADLNQLTSPPISALAIADWFLGEFSSTERPLSSVSLVISDDVTREYAPRTRAGVDNKAPATGGSGGRYSVPPADLSGVRSAVEHWSHRVGANRENLAVFYFCGHGISRGHQAALLLRDFGEPHRDLDGAIDLELLVGSMRNSTAIRQIFLLDCCRTSADDLYENQSTIGSRVLNLVIQNRGHSDHAQQFVLFPTLDGEEAFGIKNRISVFTQSIIDALSFAAADFSHGKWLVNTGTMMTAVERLVRSRVPPSHINRAKPNSPNATPFDVNEIDDIGAVRSFVTLSDVSHWGRVSLECIEPATGRCHDRINSSAVVGDKCGRFEVEEGRWRFTGTLPSNPPTIQHREQHVRLPVAFVTLEVIP